jgi:hypothetical protein
MAKAGWAVLRERGWQKGRADENAIIGKKERGDGQKRRRDHHRARERDDKEVERWKGDELPTGPFPSRTR